MLQPPLQNLAHQTLICSKSDSALNKVVQQLGAASSFFFGASWLMDSNNPYSLPINRSSDEITFYGTKDGIGFFSDSIHSIKQRFQPLDSSFACILHSLHSYCLFLFLCSPIFYSELFLLGRTRSFIIYFSSR